MRAVHDQASPEEIRSALIRVRDSGLEPELEYEVALGTYPGLADALPTFEEVDPDSEGSAPPPSEPLAPPDSGAPPLAEEPQGLPPPPPEAPLPPEPEEPPLPAGPPDPRAALRRAAQEGNRGRPANRPPRPPAA